MSRYPLAALISSLALFAAACGREEPAAPTPAAEHADDHGHGHDHDHADPGAPTDSHAGPKHDLGAAQVGAFEVAVTQVGDVTPGEGATFEIRPTGADEITAVRAWVGVESGQGSVKVKAPKRGDFYDADLEVPAQLPEGSKAWVEIETAAGRSSTAFDLARE